MGRMVTCREGDVAFSIDYGVLSRRFFVSCKASTPFSEGTYELVWTEMRSRVERHTVIISQSELNLIGSLHGFVVN